MTSSIGGEHALAYGEWVTVVNGGVCQMTGEFSSIGGPFEFDVEGLPEYTFFGGLETIPYAKIEASPAVVEVPWEGGTVEGLVQFAQKDERVSYGPIVASDPIVSLSEGRFTVDGDAFLRAGAKPLTVQFSGDQTYEGQTHTERASVQIRPAPTSLSFQPGVLTVSPAGASGPAVGVGEHGALRYELIGARRPGWSRLKG